MSEGAALGCSTGRIDAPRAAAAGAALGGVVLGMYPSDINADMGMRHPVAWGVAPAASSAALLRWRVERETPQIRAAWDMVKVASLMVRRRERSGELFQRSIQVQWR